MWLKSQYRLREMDVDDKVCEQVSMTMLSEVYPTDVIERCVQQSEPWSTKVRRGRLSTAFTPGGFFVGVAPGGPPAPTQGGETLLGRPPTIPPPPPTTPIPAP